MKKIILASALVLVLVGAGWAGRYRYDHVPSGDHAILVRTNRFTDTTEVLQKGRWVNRANATATMRVATAAECGAQASDPNHFMTLVIDFSKCERPN